MSGTLVTNFLQSDLGSSLVLNPISTGSPVVFGATPTFTPANAIYASQANANTYVQAVLQNSANGTLSSTDYIVGNNLGTDSSYYGDFGINSSNFSGSGSLNLPNATYLYSQNGDLSLGTGSANAIHFVINSGSTDAMTLDINSNLGLGVTPSAWNGVIKSIDIFGGGALFGVNSAAVGLISNAYLNSGGNWIYKTSAGASQYQTAYGSHYWYNAPSGTAANTVSFTQSMTLNASGQLGIGQTSPAYILDVGLTGTTNTININGTATLLRLAGSSFGQIFSTNALYLDAGTSQPVVFRPNGSTEAGRFDNSGNFYIGTTTQSSSAKFTLQSAGNQPCLSILGNSTSNILGDVTIIRTGHSATAVGQAPCIQLNDASYSSMIQQSSNGAIQFFSTGSGGWTSGAYFDAYGNILLGTQNRISTAFNNGVTATGYATRTGITGSWPGNQFNINWTGSAYLWIDTTNVGAISLSSDYRIKQNVQTQVVPALPRISQLRTVTYEHTDYKNLFQADGVAREGFIAHELQAVIPSAVEGEKDAPDQIQSLKLDALCSVMVKAIQELNAQVTTLQSQVTALQSKP
jgi:hypothetical protein